MVVIDGYYQGKKIYMYICVQLPCILYCYTWYDDMMTWYEDMIWWYDDMIWWYDDMVTLNDAWYGDYDTTIWYDDMMTDMIWWYDDIIWWYDNKESW